MLVSRTLSAGIRVGAGVELGGVGPLVGARLTRPTPHHGRPQGPPPFSTPLPPLRGPSCLSRALTKNLPMRTPLHSPHISHRSLYVMVETYSSTLTCHFRKSRNSVMIRPQTAHNRVAWAFSI